MKLEPAPAARLVLAAARSAVSLPQLGDGLHQPVCHPGEANDNDGR